MAGGGANNAQLAQQLCVEAKAGVPAEVADCLRKISKGARGAHIAQVKRGRTMGASGRWMAMEEERAKRGDGSDMHLGWLHEARGEQGDTDLKNDTWTWGIC